MEISRLSSRENIILDLRVFSMLAEVLCYVFILPKNTLFVYFICGNSLTACKYCMPTINQQVHGMISIGGGLHS